MSGRTATSRASSAGAATPSALRASMYACASGWRSIVAARCRRPRRAAIGGRPAGLAADVGLRRSLQFLDLLRVLKLLKLPMFIRSVQGSLFWRLSNERRAVLSIGRLLVTVLIVAHYATCVWWEVQTRQLRALLNDTAGEMTWQEHLLLLNTTADSTWAGDELGDSTDDDILRMPYLLSLHATLMLFGGNTNNLLYQWPEKVVGSFTMLVGVIVTAVIVSQVSVLMASVQASERQYVNKLSQVNVTMEKLQVPPQLRSRDGHYRTGALRHLRRAATNLSSELSKCCSLLFFTGAW